MKTTNMFWLRQLHLQLIDCHAQQAGFPTGTLREEGLDRIDPDTLLMQIFSGMKSK